MGHDDLDGRLTLVRRALDRSPEPLHVPLGIVFRPGEPEEQLETWAAHARRAADGKAFAPATLYVHLPFCARLCTYCLLSASRAPGKDAMEAYLRALIRQIELYEPIVRDLRFVSLHVGGGTPTLFDERQLDTLLSALSRLSLAEGAQIGVEAHPGTSTPGRLAVLRRHGVHRVSFGVESMTSEVLRRVNREDQNESRVRSAIAEAHRLGMQVNVDLLAGLPGETEESWEVGLRKTLALEPDSLSVNRFLGENAPLADSGFDPGDEENRRRADALLLRADAVVRETSPPRWPEEPLRTPAFGTQYVWDRTSSARRYFQDDMMGPVSTLALGHGALGHVYGRSFSAASGPIDAYVAALSAGKPPPVLVCAIDERFEKALFVADGACRGRLSLRAFRSVFHEDLASAFPRELRFLLDRGLLRLDGDRLGKPPRLDFQVTHLAAFLAHDEPTLSRQHHALEAAERRPGSLRQYESLGVEMPPSILWTRLAVRAAQAVRGKQRLAIPEGA